MIIKKIADFYRVSKPKSYKFSSSEEQRKIKLL